MMHKSKHWRESSYDSPEWVSVCWLEQDIQLLDNQRERGRQRVLEKNKPAYKTRCPTNATNASGQSIQAYCLAWGGHLVTDILAPGSAKWAAPPASFPNTWKKRYVESVLRVSGVSLCTYSWGTVPLFWFGPLGGFTLWRGYGQMDL